MSNFEPTITLPIESFSLKYARSLTFSSLKTVSPKNMFLLNFDLSYCSTYQKQACKPTLTGI